MSSARLFLKPPGIRGEVHGLRRGHRGLSEAPALWYGWLKEKRRKRQNDTQGHPETRRNALIRCDQRRQNPR